MAEKIVVTAGEHEMGRLDAKGFVGALADVLGPVRFSVAWRGSYLREPVEVVVDWSKP